MDARVEIVTAHMGADGRALESAADACDGIVAALLGAGHAPPPFQDALEQVASRLPVVVTTRVPRGGLLRATYGFRGSEQDVRASGAIAAGLLTPAAARIKLAACLGADMTRAQIAAAFAGDDAHPQVPPALAARRRFRPSRAVGCVRDGCPHADRRVPAGAGARTAP